MVAEGILDILVHPLVLLNISDYYTRLRLISDELPRSTNRTLTLYYN